jgi:tetratricopeptide (TPR) repeat protein
MAKKRRTKKQVTPKKETVVFDSSKTKQKISLFPKINRFITESWKLILVSFISGLILIGIILQSSSLYAGLQEQRKIEGERSKTEKELAFWKNSLARYKNYRDIYLKIASLEYQLGDRDSAKDDVKKALEIDPNSEKGRQLEKIVGI